MDKEYKKSSKKKLFMIIFPIITLVLVGVAIAIPFLLNIGKSKKVQDLYFSEDNVFVYGEDIFSSTLIVKYDDDSEVIIKLSDTEISDLDKDKLANSGNHLVAVSYDGYSKQMEFVILATDFTDEEISKIEYEDQFVVYTGGGNFFYEIKSIPQGSYVLYSVDDEVERNERYELTAPGNYTIHAYIIKPNYNEYHIEFNVRIADVTFEMDGFIEDNGLYSKNVESGTETFNLEEVINKGGDIQVEVYKDENLSEKVDIKNLSIKEGKNLFYMTLSLEGIETTRTYKIEIYRYQIFEVSFFFKDQMISKTTYDECVDSAIEEPSFSKEGYNITGWKSENGDIIEFPYIPKSNLKLNAVYKTISYKITYNLGNGTLENKKDTYTIEDETFTIGKPTKTGYTFIGWKVNENESIEEDYTVTKGSTGDLTLEAVYEIITYSITYNLADGIYDGLKTTYTVEDETFTIGQPTKTGYTFVGWTGTGIEGKVNEITITKGSTEDREYTANWQINKYVITWENYDNSVLEIDKDVEYGSMPHYDGEEPTKPSDQQYNYTFAGWTPQIGKVEGNCKYVATFSPQIRQYTITFDSQEGSAVESITDDYGTIIGERLPQTERKGYNFLGWFTEEVEGIKVEKDYQITENVTLYAHWEEKTFAINTDKNITNGNVEIAQEAKYNSTVSVKVTPNTGYRLKRVYFESEGSQQDIVGETFKMPASDITIYVEFEAIDYTITIKSSNGNIQLNKTTANYNEEIIVSVTPNTGYRLKRLYYTLNEEEVIINENKFNMPANNIEVVGEFEAISYSITYNLGNGTLENKKDTYTVEDETFTIGKPTKTGYTFIGWKVNENESIEEDYTVTKGSTGDLTLEAVYEIITYSITYNLGNGTLENKKDTYTVEDETFTIGKPTKTGYTFIGWKVNENESIEENYTVTKGSTGDLTLEAVYEIITYSITYNLGNGTLENKKDTYTVEDETFTIGQPTKTGYTFVGWSGTEIEGKVNEITITKGSTENREYTANWQINKYTYTFYSDDKIIKTETIDYNTQIIAPQNPLKESVDGINYHFKSWDKEVPSVIGDKDLEFRAVYEEEIFTKGLLFTKNENKNTYEVSKGSASDNNIIIPATYNNTVVNKVPQNGFSDMPNLTTITFKENNNITSIGKNSFANCPSLTSVSGLNEISSIPSGAFENCLSLVNFNIGEKVVIIGEKAFKNSSLTTVNIPSSVVAIEKQAFDGCPIKSYQVSEQNANYASKDGNLYNKNYSILIRYAIGNESQTFSIPATVQKIEQGAFVKEFRENQEVDLKLKNLIIPTSVKTISANTIDPNVTIFTYFAEEPSGWDSSIFTSNTIYWNEGWDIVDGVPQNTLAVSNFKQGIYLNWMSYIKDETKLFDIAMPGSHDAGTNGLGDLYKTQNSGFYEQMTGGVRYFDTRVAEFNGNVRCVHADSGAILTSSNAQGVFFSDLLNDVVKFINENPSEIIILDFQHIWSDFSSKVLPMIESYIPKNKILNKSQSPLLSDVTIGQLRSWGVNIVIFVNDTSSNKPDFSVKNFLYERSKYLLSPYDGASHKNGGSELISHFQTYFAQSDGSKLFVLQSQRTGGGVNFNIASLEKEFRGSANAYLRSLTLEENVETLKKVNVVMRDFCVDDNIGTNVKAQETMQSIIYLNFKKGNIKESRENYFKVLIDYDSIELLSKQY